MCVGGGGGGLLGKEFLILLFKTHTFESLQRDQCKSSLKHTHTHTESSQCLKHTHTGAPLRILGPLDSIFTRALLRSGGGLYITEIAIAFPSQSFFPLLPNQIILFQLLKSLSFVCNGKVIIFRFGFL